ncbi:MAG TPA: pyridoxal-dependent decarboxylase [Myxococcota bacterium]|nr:pyridoxal-dependent decarboxylase [Myxococcota bacterium]
MADLLDRLRALERETAPLLADAERRRELASAAIAYAERQIAAIEQAPPVSHAKVDLSELALGAEPLALADVIERLARNVDAGGQQPSSGRFFAYLPGGNLYESALADFLAAVGGRYSARAYVAAGAVRIENEVLGWLARMLGMPAACAGNLTSGGSLANLIALVTAREAAGVRAADVPRTVVYATEQAHHSLAKGLRIAGLGETVQRRVAMDARYRMDAAALAAQVAADRAQGLAPWLLLASAGTTEAGAIDPLGALAEIAQREKLWLHVDAAYGGMFALTEEGKRKLAGIERADSVVVDPHKGMFLPWGIGAVLCRHRAAMHAAFSFEANYIVERSSAEQELSPMDASPELSRPFRGLRVWLPLALLGTRPFAAALEEKLLLARWAYSELAKTPGFELGPEPDLSVFLFRLAGADAAARDARTQRLYEALLADGRAAFSPTTIAGERWLRMAVLGARTHLREVEDALAVIREIAARVR